ncbi:Aspartic protease PEP3 [Madurella mycetomatis]|uniref:Aspartic protease PEP3 n=1 Tax=Madurella mycetomatis TaxID=100816 RepID=A0A175WGR8_9PEZI|nr:Aspartic protease PEP3 [Madurella mycetomatis]
MRVVIFAIASWLTSSVAGLPSGPGQHVASSPVRVGFRDKVTTHYIPMRKHDLPVSENHGLRRRIGGPTSLRNAHDVYYIVDLVVGNQTIPVSVDTGSSDTWLIQEPYECVSFWFDPGGTEPNCGLGSGFKGNLSGGVIPDLPPFVRSYVDGTFVRGFYGREDITIGDITAKNQRLALVNYTYWHGDGQTSGLLGLGYPYLTSLDGADQNQPPYDPVFTTMWKAGSIDPLFSIALSRSENSSTSGLEEQESYLALGGLPPVEVDETSWASTPIHGMSSVPQWDFLGDEKGMYIIKPNAFVYGRGGNGSQTGEELSKNTTQLPVLIDVGSTLSILPKNLVNQIYAAFDPPAKYLSSTGLFYAPCNATVPTFGVEIGESTFYIAPEDLLRQTVRDPTGEYCRVGITDSDSVPHILGVTFLTNVVAVFDVEHGEMRFASRKKY